MNKFVPLEQLLACERSPQRPQALRSEQQLDWQQWRRRVGQWRSVLAHERGTTWGLYHNDAFEFSAILFALWASGKVACVPGSNQPLVVNGLRDRVAGYIGDFDLSPQACHLPVPDTNAEPIDTPVTLGRDQRVLEIYTSGSSGEPQAIDKYLCQLSEEVANLETLWGELADGATTVATVSHHHIYGLLFRVLWPLAAGRCFDSGLSDYLEELNSHPPGCDSVVLISSPSHLSRIPDKTNWQRLQSRCRAIFSSGAPLPRTASLAARQLLRQAPIEVFGSSETGGIAYRQQSPDGEVAWQAMPGVQLGLDTASTCLKIRSPHLAPAAASAWYITSDKATLQVNGQFQLLGRADRIVKVEGKRVSLTEMEKRLQAHPLVTEARLLVLTTQRTEIAAVIVLNQQGTAQLARDGRRAVNTQLSAHLLEQFERTVVPRRWRYPAELPLDRQGKVTQQNLTSLFADSKQGRPLLPEVVQQQQAGDAFTLQMRIPDDLFYFQGHFPVAAILPGVVQIRWAVHYAEQLLDFAGNFSHLEAVKFQHVIRPGQQVELVLKCDRTAQKLSFRYHSESGPHSSGRIVNRS